MWLSNRRKFLVIGAAAALAALPACNFAPVYATGGSGTKLENRVFIPEPTTEDLYQVVQRFEERLGRAGEADATMRLTVSVSKSVSGLGTTATGSTTRYQWTGFLTYTLVNAETGASIDSGSIRRFTGYSATANVASTLSAERDAGRRLMIILSDALVDRFLLIEPDLLP